jgi:hypothetical protein
MCGAGQADVDREGAQPQRIWQRARLTAEHVLALLAWCCLLADTAACTFRPAFGPISANFVTSPLGEVLVHAGLPRLLRPLDGLGLVLWRGVDHLANITTRSDAHVLHA